MKKLHLFILALLLISCDTTRYTYTIELSDCSGNKVDTIAHTFAPGMGFHPQIENYKMAVPQFVVGGGKDYYKRLNICSFRVLSKKKL